MKCILFVAHGSRSFNHKREAEALVMDICRDIEGVCELSFMEKLHPNIKEGLENLTIFGCEVVDIVPLFLTLGAHAGRDIPSQLNITEFNKYIDINIGGKNIKIRYIWPFLNKEIIISKARDRIIELLKE